MDKVTGINSFAWLIVLSDWFRKLVRWCQHVRVPSYGWHLVRSTLAQMLALALVPLLALCEAKSINQNIIQDNSHWNQLANFTVDNSDIDVSKYKSSLTGRAL